jgi:carbamate kinase
VASPKPLNIVEHREIQKLIELDFIVICCGGGGIPVVRKERQFRGVEAVIDKDLASSVLAQKIKADIFVIASDVEGAAINWGKADQKILRKVPLAEMEKYVQQGQFPAGSMGPKVDALIQFFNATGNRGVICQLSDIEKAIAGEAGTEIVK